MIKQSSLKKRHISHLVSDALLKRVQLFIPPQQPVEKSLKNRVQVLASRGAWGQGELPNVEESKEKTV